MKAISINRVIQALVITTSLAVASLAMAEPSAQDINQALKAGDGAKAEHLLKEVLAAHPDSAKAHFKYSEVLAAEGRVSEAKAELSKAEAIEPGLAFAKPEAVSNLKHKIYGNGQSSNTNATNSLLKWAGIAFVVFLVVMVFRSFRRPQIQPNYAATAPVPNGYGPQNPYPPQGGYGPQGYGPQSGPGVGSGIMGGLATGAAVGAGIVAGEMLMHKVLDGDHSNSNNIDSGFANPSPTTDFSDISGNDFVDSDNGSWDNDSSLGDSSSFDSDNSGDWS